MKRICSSEAATHPQIHALDVKVSKVRKRRDVSHCAAKLVVFEIQLSPDMCGQWRSRIVSGSGGPEYTVRFSDSPVRAQNQQTEERTSKTNVIL